MPIHPERVTFRAVQTGLSATIDLQKDIKNKTTKKHYESSRNIWKIARQVYLITKERGNADYSYLLKAEPQIRDNMLKMLYEQIARYGHTEVTRQKNSDDTVGPFNQRTNVCGAALRDFSVCMFPMPEPTQFGFRTRRVGKTRKRFRVAGYESSSFGPRVELSHADASSLDFGDAARSHNECLSSFCTIQDVPVKETARYSNLFLLLSQPYLEHIYSEYSLGKPAFRKGLNKVLRTVKQLIRVAGFQPRMYEKRTVTKHLSVKPASADSKFFHDQLKEAKKFYGPHLALDELERLLKHKFIRAHGLEPEPYLTLRDVEHIRDEAKRRARVQGSILHRRISNLFPSPWHLNDAIYRGHKYSGSLDYAIISEVPIETALGKGKIDIVLLERVISIDGKRGLWRPVLVCEIKTRMGQQWYPESEVKRSEARSRKGLDPRIVVKFPISNRSLDDNEWEVIVKSTPDKKATKQVKVYAQALVERFKESTGQESAGVIQGTIGIEAIADVNEVRKIIEALLINAYESVKNISGTIKRTVIRPMSGTESKMALVIHKQDAPKRVVEESAKAPWSPPYSPFQKTEEGEHRFILYIAGKSPPSAGQSAAWNARYYHGLQILRELSESSSNAELVWLDLASQFHEPRLAEARLRLRPRSNSEEERGKAHPDEIREFFETIEVRGLLEDILSFLYEDTDFPSFDIPKKSKGRIIIVSGADTLRDATPESHRDRLQLVLDQLLHSLPDDERTTVVWFDSPVPSTEKAIPYSSRALLPFFETSALAEVVTEIIWNLPVAPRSAVEPDKWYLPTIGDSPMYDDIRMIIRHSPTKMSTELVHIPFLHGWSKRFRNQGSGLVVREQDLKEIIPEKELRHRMRLLAFTMLPWLVPLWADTPLSAESEEPLGPQFSRLVREFTDPPDNLTFSAKTVRGASRVPSILELLRFRLPESRDGKLFVAMTAGRINSQRLYRSANRLMTQPRPIAIPTPLVEETSTPEVELEHDWTFGVWFQSAQDADSPRWMVVQDSRNEARMLVGCFTNQRTDKNGFLWAETRQTVLTEHSLEDVLALPQTIMVCRQSEQGMETWSIDPDSSELEYSGVIELIARGRSSIGRIRAFRQTLFDIGAAEPPRRIHPSKMFIQRVTSALRQYIDSVARPTHVTVRLEMVEDVCKVTFVDGDDDALQQVEVIYTADLIERLRWPMTHQGPMYTDTGKHVTWNVFEDIEYGELDFISPYVTFKAARTETEQLPRRISQFFDLAEPLKVSIEHDSSVCPIVQGCEVIHGACWRIVLPHDCPEGVRQQLERPMTGEDVNGLLSSGRIFAGKVYPLDVQLPTVSESDESIVFHEERYIRMFLREKGLPLKPLEPGTFLEIERQTWEVEVSSPGTGYISLSARSTVTELLFGGSAHDIRLDGGQGRKEECKRILKVITSDIPRKRILDYGILKKRIMSMLEALGHPLEGYDDVDEEYVEPAVWEVTLFVIDSVIHWEGEQVDGGSGHRSGALFDDPKILFGGGVRKAIREVRESVECEVVPELERINNLDDVVGVQVPDVVREIRSNHGMDEK